MRAIHPHSLFLGNAGDTRDFVALQRAGIEALIDLAMTERPLSPPREMVYCRFPIVDGPGNARPMLLGAIKTTEALIRARMPVLVFCSAGMSRSPAIAAGALSLVTGRAAAACLSELVPGGGIDVSSALWGQVLAALAWNTEIQLARP